MFLISSTFPMNNMNIEFNHLKSSAFFKFGVLYVFVQISSRLMQQLPPPATQRGHTWLQASEFSFLFLMLKTFLRRT